MAGKNHRPEPEDPETALRVARAAFVDSFASACADIERSFAASDPQALRTARTRAHRIAGLAGMIGFPTVSARAQDLEDAIGAAGRGADAAKLRAALDAMRRAFDAESR